MRELFLFLLPEWRLLFFVESHAVPFFVLGILVTFIYNIPRRKQKVSGGQEIDHFVGGEEGTGDNCKRIVETWVWRSSYDFACLSVKKYTCTFVHARALALWSIMTKMSYCLDNIAPSITHTNNAFT